MPGRRGGQAAEGNAKAPEGCACKAARSRGAGAAHERHFDSGSAAGGLGAGPGAAGGPVCRAAGGREARTGAAGDCPPGPGDAADGRGAAPGLRGHGGPDPSAGSGGGAAGHPGGDGPPDADPPPVRQRGAGGGNGSDGGPRSGFFGGPDGGGDAGQHGDHLLYDLGLLRGGWRQTQPLGRPRRPGGGPGRLRRRGPDGQTAVRDFSARRAGYRSPRKPAGWTDYVY